MWEYSFCRVPSYFYQTPKGPPYFCPPIPPIIRIAGLRFWGQLPTTIISRSSFPSSGEPCLTFDRSLLEFSPSPDRHFPHEDESAFFLSVLVQRPPAFLIPIKQLDVLPTLFCKQTLFQTFKKTLRPLTFFLADRFFFPFWGNARVFFRTYFPSPHFLFYPYLRFNRTL